MNTTTRKPSLLTFFVVTYAVSWLIWVPLAASHLRLVSWAIPEGISSIVRLFGVLGPAAVAISLSALVGGRQAVAELLGRLKIWRVGWAWWGAAVLVQPGLLLAVGLAYNALGGEPKLASGLPMPVAAFIFQAVILAIATLGEEIGWRGFALPALLQSHGALAASLILGTAWTVWHLPFWLLQDSFAAYGAGYFVLNLLLILPASIYVTWVFNHTRGSTLLAAGFHLSLNLVNVVVLPVTGLIAPFIALIVVEWVLALLLLRLSGAQHLVRSGPAGRPSYAQ